jgi:hypothetical protein
LVEASTLPVWDLPGNPPNPFFLQRAALIGDLGLEPDATENSPADDDPDLDGEELKEEECDDAREEEDEQQEGEKGEDGKEEEEEGEEGERDVTEPRGKKPRTETAAGQPPAPKLRARGSAAPKQQPKPPTTRRKAQMRN